MTSLQHLMKELSKMSLEELKRQHRICLSGDESNPVSTQMLFYMKDYGYLTQKEFAYINEP